MDRAFFLNDTALLVLLRLPRVFLDVVDAFHKGQALFGVDPEYLTGLSGVAAGQERNADVRVEQVLHNAPTSSGGGSAGTGNSPSQLP